MAQGLRFLHASRPPIAHGSLSSSNVLVDRHLVARLADAGLPPPPPAATGCNQPTTPAAAAGQWVAPEFQGTAPKVRTTKADAFAYGILIYECLARAPPPPQQGPGATTKPSMASGGSSVGALPALSRHPSAILRHAGALSPPPGCSTEAAALMWDCLCAEPAHRPEFAEIDRRVRTLAELNAITSDATDEDCNSEAGDDAGGKPLRRRRLDARRRGSELVAMGLIPPPMALALARGEKVPPEPKEMITMSCRSPPPSSPLSLLLCQSHCCNL